MTPRKNALVWRLAIPVAIALSPLSLAAQNGARTPDEVLEAESYQAPPREHLDLWARWGAGLEKYVKNPPKAEPKKMTNDQALVVR